MSKGIGIIFIILGAAFLSVTVAFALDLDMSYWTDILSKYFPYAFGLILGVGFIGMGIAALQL